MKLSTGAFIAALQFFGVASAATIDEEIARVEKLNDRCRGGSGDSALAQKACEERDKMVSDLGKKGWCYGHEGQAGYERRWERCAWAETVSIYLPSGGKDGMVYGLDAAPLVIYPNRRCPFPELAGHQRMRLALMGRYQLCSYVNDGQTIVLSPLSPPSAFQNEFFAIARINEDRQSATVTHPGFDSKKAYQQFMERQENLVRRVLAPTRTPENSRQ